jgi:hypothetical protein
LKLMKGTLLRPFVFGFTFYSILMLL